jgi:hypothetical protein
MMADYWARDSRIEEDSALRQLEEKVHYLMSTLCDAGIISSFDGAGVNVSDDVAADANTVGGQAPRG